MDPFGVEDGVCICPETERKFRQGIYSFGAGETVIKQRRCSRPEADIPPNVMSVSDIELHECVPAPCHTGHTLGTFYIQAVQTCAPRSWLTKFCRKTRMTVQASDSGYRLSYPRSQLRYRDSAAGLELCLRSVHILPSLKFLHQPPPSATMPAHKIPPPHAI